MISISPQRRGKQALAKYTVATQALGRNARWVEQLSADQLTNPTTQNRVSDVVVWCLDFLELSPTTNLAAWLVRRPHRSSLDEPIGAARSPKGRKAILELIRLTVSALESSAPFLPEVDASLLPDARIPTARSAEHLAKLHEGYQHFREKQTRNGRGDWQPPGLRKTK